MKKSIICFILICCMILPCTIFLFSCSYNNDLNNAVIANWNNYTHIGAGIISEQETNTYGASRKATTVSKSSKQTKRKGKAKLFGITKDGEYEVIKFKDENDKEKEQTLYLSGFSACENFTFISYSTNQVNSIGNFDTNAARQYIIDNKTGKLFRLDNIFESMFVFGARGWGESENAFYCLADKHSDPYTGYTSIYKISLENEELKIEKIFDQSTLTAFDTDFIVDKYGNIFAKNGKFIIKSDRTIHTLNSLTLFKALNGLVYAGEQVFNEYGELVDSTFVPEKLQFSEVTTNTYETKNDYLAKQDEDTYYYFIDNPETFVQNFKSKLYKITFINEIEYTVENIALEGYAAGLWNKTLVENDRIYYLSNGEVGYCDILTGAATVLTKDYLFNDIWTDNKGNVCFSGLNSTMDSVQGIIHEDDSITVGIFSNGYDVIFVKPINEFN